jgi:hypothetical protein
MTRSPFSAAEKISNDFASFVEATRRQFSANLPAPREGTQCTAHALAITDMLQPGTEAPLPRRARSEQDTPYGATLLLLGLGLLATQWWLWLQR